MTVYFSTREPLKCLMYAPNDSVREIYVHGEDSGPSYVHHRITSFNEGIPPSIRAKRAQSTISRPAPPTAVETSSNCTPLYSHSTAAIDTMTQSVASNDEDDSMDYSSSDQSDQSDQSETDEDKQSVASENEDMVQSQDGEDSNGSVGSPTVYVRDDFISDNPDQLLEVHAALPEDSPLWYRAQPSRRYTSKPKPSIALNLAKGIESKITLQRNLVIHEFSETYNPSEVLHEADDDFDPFPAPFPDDSRRNYAFVCRLFPISSRPANVHNPQHRCGDHDCRRVDRLLGTLCEQFPSRRRPLRCTRHRSGEPRSSGTPSRC